MTNLVTVCCDCSCEKEKSLIRSFLSSVVCSSQSVDCSIQWHSVLVVGSGAPSFFLCRTIQPLYCTVLVSRGSSMVLVWRHYRFLGPNYVHLRYRRFFFSLLSKSSYILRMPQNFEKSSTYFCPYVVPVKG